MMSVMKELYSQLNELFIHRRDAYAIQTDGGDYAKVDGMITDDLLRQHLLGDTTIGVYQVNNGTVKWICYDIDDHNGDGDMFDLLRVMLCLGERGIQFYVEESGSPNSYHVWVFVEEAPVEDAYVFARSLIKGIDVEVFPKQRKPKPYGNLVKLPLGLNRKTGRFSKMRLPRVIIDRVSIPNMKMPVIEREHDVMPVGIRPCLKRLISEKVELVGTYGHATRCALCVELLNNGVSIEDIHEVFKLQSDYDYDYTQSQIESLLGYKRYKCSTLREQCGHYIKGCESCGV